MKMKKSIEELRKDLDETYEEWEYLKKNYPWYRKDYSVNPLSNEIRNQYRFIGSRLRNIKLNINQAVWKEFGKEARERREKIK